jgi:hypothetical protein
MRKEILILSLIFVAGQSCSDKSSPTQQELQKETRFTASREYVHFMFMAVPPSGRFPMYSPTLCLKAAGQIKESDIEILKFECIDSENPSLSADITWRGDKFMEQGQDSEICFSTDFNHVDHFKGVPEKFKIFIEFVDKSVGEKFHFVSESTYSKSDFDLNKKP